MDRKGRARRSRAPIEAGELALVKKVARAFRTTEREDLEAELARELLSLKTNLPLGIRHWEAYLAKSLYNKADNWIRAWRRKEQKKVPLAETPSAGTEEPYTPQVTLPAALGAGELQIAFAQLWNELDPRLRSLWEMLIEENGNQASVARRLGKHRNTIRLWIGRIKKVLSRHGF